MAVKKHIARSKMSDSKQQEVRIKIKKKQIRSSCDAATSATQLNILTQ